MRYVAKAFLVGIGLLWIPTGASGQDAAKIAEGARGWSQNCTRCHNARSPLERNDSDWAIIVGHMRARANLTKRQATAIAVYLQAVNRPEGMPIVVAPPQSAAAKAAAGAPQESTSPKKEGKTKPKGGAGT